MKKPQKLSRQSKKKSDQGIAEFQLDGEVPPHIGRLWKDKFQSEFAFLGEVGRGKTGIAYKIEHRRTKVQYCLKMVNPDITDADAIEKVRESLTKEVDILLPVSHQCLPKIIKFNMTGDLPFYVCTFHPGKTFAEFQNKGHNLDVNQSFFLISLLISVLDYLHQSGRPHCDIHSKNLMIHNDVFRFGILLIDFGSAHRESDESPYTSNRGLPFVKDTEDKARFQARVKRSEANEGFKHSDFRALGELLAIMSDHFFSDASIVQKNAYRDYCHDLAHGYITDWVAAKERLLAVIDPLHKITMLDRLFLDGAGHRVTIPLPVSHWVPVGEAPLAVINTPIFQKLRMLGQLSFCEWRFPGATHTRFEHSLGVFHLMRRAIEYLCQDPVFRNNFSLNELKGCLLAGLLHDVGHYPLAHIVEQFAAGGRLKHDASIRHDVHHLTNSKYLLEHNVELKAAIADHWGNEALTNCIEILDGKHGALSALLDGAIDCDKMDYLVRDSFHCGLKFGRAVDVNDLLRNIRITRDRKGLAIVESAVTAVEGLMVLQNQMLASVYWHPTVRAIICMAHAALAHITKDTGGDRLREIVRRLHECRSNYEAVDRVLLPTLKEVEPTRFDQLKQLILLHVEPHYIDIFRPIRTYQSTDERQEDEATTIYNSINHKLPNSSTASVQPVDWHNVSKLRKAFHAALQEKGILAQRGEVIVDVPLGKTSHRTITVIRSDSEECEITEVSHLNRTVFEEPTIFVSPIRVFISPRVFNMVNQRTDSIVKSAEERFHHPNRFTPEVPSKFIPQIPKS